MCIDKDKNSPKALMWAIDSLVRKGQTIILVHVNTKAGTSGGVEDGAGFKQPTDRHVKDLFLPFRCLCTRMVIGATVRGGGWFWFKMAADDVPTTISNGAPDFCDVYIVNKGKVS